MFSFDIREMSAGLEFKDAKPDISKTGLLQNRIFPKQGAQTGSPNRESKQGV
jgi:hypothetical protein